MSISNIDFFIFHMASPWIIELLDPNCSKERVNAAVQEMIKFTGLELITIQIAIQRCVSGRSN